VNNQGVTSYFEHYARVNDLSERGRHGTWRYFDKTLGPVLPHDKDARIVDIGCGVGLVLEWLKARGYRNAAGVDSDEGQVGFARGLGLDVSHSTDTTLWLRSQQAARLIVLKDVLEHVPYVASIDLMRAACHALDDEGSLYIAVPNANSSFATRWRYIDATHLRSYTEHSLHWDLLQAGLTAVSIRDDTAWTPGSLAGVVQQGVRAVFRLLRRIECIAEFGRDGIHAPLGLNLVALARADAPRTDR
jgi:2-polyprenyl-3-methyl-5-hydroxy-6-metoxy-1,4-benzoquinol methylase